jgi:hypothetical protein
MDGFTGDVSSPHKAFRRTERKSGVNGARTRLFSLRRVTYVGEDTNGIVRKRTKEAVFLSVWCQLFRVGIKNLKEPGALLLNLSCTYIYEPNRRVLS